ncbi:receptor-type tyrosine-protein phosphatase H isoform X2 [Astyanax mexicanus]|uniref:receptor-type tyrosine-protein phosphatase H isoform X2 n=1 Tax=Astyanax mexicanus TaxID=7994 RepID=UPI0020CB24DF|nr:receptor-type tyrosine-protein phosphatase H isoform X2 [Astyanax mexicanus]
MSSDSTVTSDTTSPSVNSDSSFTGVISSDSTVTSDTTTSSVNSVPAYEESEGNADNAPSNITPSSLTSESTFTGVMNTVSTVTSNTTPSSVNSKSTFTGVKSSGSTVTSDINTSSVNTSSAPKEVETTGSALTSKTTLSSMLTGVKSSGSTVTSNTTTSSVKTVSALKGVESTGSTVTSKTTSSSINSVLTFTGVKSTGSTVTSNTTLSSINSVFPGVKSSGSTVTSNTTSSSVNNVSTFTGVKSSGSTVTSNTNTSIVNTSSALKVMESTGSTVTSRTTLSSINSVVTFTGVKSSGSTVTSNTTTSSANNVSTFTEVKHSVTSNTTTSSVNNVSTFTGVKSSVTSNTTTSSVNSVSALKGVESTESTVTRRMSSGSNVTSNANDEAGVNQTITSSNVYSAFVRSRTETGLILQWNKVNNSSSYSYRLNYNGINININGSEGGSVVIIISSLSPGTKYTFTLYTVFEGVESSGFNFASVTTPLIVNSVSAKSRTETGLTLQWNKVNNSSSYSYRLNYNGINITINGSEGGSVVNYTVSSLSPGTKYTFTLYTVFEGVESSGFNFASVTTPSKVYSAFVRSRTETGLTLQWNKVNNSSSYSYRLNYNGINITINGSEGGSVVNYTVSSLSPGTKYTFTLYTVFEGVESSGFNFASVTTPSKVYSAFVRSRTETGLTLQWNKVNNSSSYSYRLNYNGINITINGSEGGSVVNYTVSSLSPGTKYTFTLYTVFEGVESSGFNFASVTTPSKVYSAFVRSRTETGLTLQWNKVNNSSSYSYRLNYNGINITINGSEGGSVVNYTVSSLSPGTKYTFTLYTVFEGVESSGFNFASVTTPSSVNSISVKSRSENGLTLQWNKVNNSNSYSYRLNYDGINININGSEGGSVVNYTVSSLSPGTKYTFTLYTVFKEVESSGFNFTNVTIPATVTGLGCKYASGGYGLTVFWDPPVGERTGVKVDGNGQSLNASGESLSIGGLQPAQWYTLTVTALSWDLHSKSASVTCQTDPGGVIAGVLVFLLLVIILCVGIFIWRRKRALPSVFGNSKSKSVEHNLPSDKYKPIPLKKFPEHFISLSRDDNRGFSVEYEDLGTVGTDQSRAAALFPENKSKNRFTNVLAYDLSRVKLTQQDGPDSDYINANYMPGYNRNSRQYIAAQGPLPCTISDFWRMVWEQKSTAIVMLTNCVENGRPKCEQYWPLDYTPCIYGNLLVTIQSEHKEKSWTLREFVVRNKDTSEERRVMHFHFTAWPDHGVPAGTDELIQFRELVRHHIERFPTSGPTVVHCSAGVGRTGTLIALDTLLQQLVKEEAVNIAACVHHMRLNRPLMVQTESQYVFLHQCIMDSLQPKEDFIPEPIYENSDMIYANSMVLRQCSGNSPV